MANNNPDTVYSQADKRTDSEPATAHDVTEGGVIGAVGGAVVGGLAGGPVGAVIGAVVGGAASAGAVDLVDQHDHDYDRTPGSPAQRGYRTDEPVNTYTGADYRGVNDPDYRGQPGVGTSIDNENYGVLPRRQPEPPQPLHDRAATDTLIDDDVDTDRTVVS